MESPRLLLPLVGGAAPTGSPGKSRPSPAPSFPWVEGFLGRGVGGVLCPKRWDKMNNNDNNNNNKIIIIIMIIMMMMIIY